MTHPILTRIGITGSPATGKKSVGLELAKITGLKFVSVNEFAINGGFGGWVGDEFVVDIRRLRGRIDTKNKIVVGHLLPYVVPRSKLDFVAILRCSPLVLKRRYKRRGYSQSKTIENLEAEMIGDVASASLSAYGIHKLAEIDMTRIRSPSGVANRILDMSIGVKPRSFGKVDWLSNIHSATKLRSTFCA